MTDGALPAHVLERVMRTENSIGLAAWLVLWLGDDEEARRRSEAEVIWR